VRDFSSAPVVVHCLWGPLRDILFFCYGESVQRDRGEKKKEKDTAKNGWDGRVCLAIDRIRSAAPITGSKHDARA
jgi:hypothetical protein